MDCILPGFSVHGILQARILESESESCPVVAHSLGPHGLWPTLWDPMDCGPLGSSVHGMLQARILEWIAVPFSRMIFLTQGLNLGLQHCRQILYPLSHLESPMGAG